MPRRTAPIVSVGARLQAILEAFTETSPLLTLSELSRRTGLPLTTTHRLVGELLAGGLLERDELGRYRVGLRMWEIGSLAPRGLGLRASALPFLGDLFDATRNHVQLAVREGNEVVYLERISARDAVHVVSRVGGRLPLHATAVGLVLLAHAEHEVREQVLAAPLRRFTERTLGTAAQLRRALADVRRDGYAVCNGAVELVSLSVAAPVRDQEDNVVAALSVVVPAKGANPRALIPVVRAAARGISRALGAPSGLRLPVAARHETHVLPEHG
ncbi:IclR family transcriptional regulator [Kutzneria albida]|uniref:IclR family transcription regulator n=1 Tax=Kutzneria albida DSM 43870 TaxID=1449976 RepID=W5W4X7_9PSEU|nr:IclR family transcriptional regulator [Kutzneria albida]AHH96278.1 IclR family transcription regulator [Kutzneria albida DSM 43870]